MLAVAVLAVLTMAVLTMAVLAVAMLTVAMLAVLTVAVLTTVQVDDLMEAYWWLRDHTPEDARVMAWWDYGYQISGVANRTTLADGNTWNHEHIALLGA